MIFDVYSIIIVFLHIAFGFWMPFVSVVLLQTRKDPKGKVSLVHSELGLAFIQLSYLSSLRSFVCRKRRSRGSLWIRRLT